MAGRGAARGEEDGDEEAQPLQQNAIAAGTGCGNAHHHAILPGCRGNVCAGIPPLLPVGGADANRDRDHYAHPNAYPDCHLHADEHTTAPTSSTKPDSCPHEHAAACANDHPYADCRTNHGSYGHADAAALNAAVPVGSVSQLSDNRPAPDRRRSVVRKMPLLNHSWQRLLLGGPLAARLDARQA